MLEYEQNYTLKKVDIFTRQLPTQKHQFKPKRTDFVKIILKTLCFEKYRCFKEGACIIFTNVRAIH